VVPPREQGAKTPPQARSPERILETKICGVHACAALFEYRPAAIIKLWISEERVRQFSSLLKACAERRLAYHVVETDELARVTGTLHHEGICILAKVKPPLGLPSILNGCARTTHTCLVGLEDVQNPHNLGAILRVCAHFSVPAVLALGETPTTLSTAAWRTAEGGAEHVDVVPCLSPGDPLALLKNAGFRIYATSQHAPVNVYDLKLPARVVFLFGSESFGLSRPLVALADAHVRISGTGFVESLNVACACTALLGEFWRQYAPPVP
jgi:TrmH RNA methyltransferase